MSGWVRQTETVVSGHECAPPMREAAIRIPAAPMGESGAVTLHTYEVPGGEWNDLWRCGCGRLWRVGNDCDACDPGRLRGACMGGGYHPGASRWRPASGWQQFTAWLRRR